MATKLFKSKEFIEKALDICKNYKTVYMWGTYGATCTSSLISAKTNQYPKWYNTIVTITNPDKTKSKVTRSEKLRRQNIGMFAFDCVGLIKGIFWGWDGKNPVKYRGEGRKSPVPDTDTYGMWKRCVHQSSDWSKIRPGDMLYKKGHVGIYIGDGLGVEATSIWGGKVLISNVKGLGTHKGYYTRTWTSFGQLPWIDYSDQEVKPEPVPEPTPSPEPEPTPSRPTTKMKVMSKTELRVRKGAGTNQKIVGSNRSGKIVEVYLDEIKQGVGSKKGWVYIPKDGGWSSLDFLVEIKPVEPKPIQPEKKLTKMKVVSKQKDLRYRKGAGTNQKILGSNKRGTIIEVDMSDIRIGVGSKKGWVYIPKQKGWTSLDFLEEVK